MAFDLTLKQITYLTELELKSVQEGLGYEDSGHYERVGKPVVAYEDKMARVYAQQVRHKTGFQLELPLPRTEERLYKLLVTGPRGFWVPDQSRPLGGNFIEGDEQVLDSLFDMENNRQVFTQKQYEDIVSRLQQYPP